VKPTPKTQPSNTNVITTQTTQIQKKPTASNLMVDALKRAETMASGEVPQQKLDLLPRPSPIIVQNRVKSSAGPSGAQMPIIKPQVSQAAANSNFASNSLISLEDSAQPGTAQSSMRRDPVAI